MIEESAQIVECVGTVAWVETQRTSTCGSCAASKGCGSAALAKVLGRRRTRVRVLNGVQASVGEQVIIGLQERALLKGALAIYLVPLFGLLAGALLGVLLAERLLVVNVDIVSMAFGGIGAAVGLLWLRYYARSIRNDERYQPVVLRRERGQPIERLINL